MRLNEIFPYQSFRAGQQELAESVYDTCKRHDKLVIEAMSGFGKTAPVLTGSIMAAEEDDVHIVYACRTKRQVFRVAEELQRIQTKFPVGAAQLFAKTDYCLLKETSGFTVDQESFKWYCTFNTTNNLCSYFLNIGLLGGQTASLVKEFSSSLPVHSELLQKCRATHVCPYEVAKLAMTTSRVLLTTYHYLLDDAMKSLLFSSTGWDSSRTIAIIDEAHNLRDFLKNCSSTSLSLTDVQKALDDARLMNFEPATSFLEELSVSLRQFSSGPKKWNIEANDLLGVIKEAHDASWLPNIALELSTCAGIGWQSISSGRNLPTSIMRVGAFLTNLLSSSETGTNVIQSEDGFHLVSTNPSDRFSVIASRYHSLILLSGTINPSDLFLRSIGLRENTPIHQVNPNQTFNVRTVIDTGLSTRFRLRGQETYSRIAEKISAIAKVARGSIGLFLPSYAVLESLRPLLNASLVDRKIMTEDRNLSNLEAEQIMKSFKSNPGSILLAVQGARFSEGEDFPGDQMDVAVVVGLSLPRPSPMMYAEYANSRFDKHDSYLIISLLPALRKAIQAAGRHIRSPDKKGMVFLMDSRFNQPEIVRMIPDWLKKDRVTGDFPPKEIERMVRDFFDAG